MINISFLKIFLVAALLSLMLGPSLGELACGFQGYCAERSNPCQQIAGACPVPGRGGKCCHDWRKFPGTKN